MGLRDMIDRPGRSREVERRYQGREFTTHLKAPTQVQLDSMISATQEHSRRMDTGPVEVISSGEDPDGGYEAIIRAHNFNPIKWVRERFGKEGRKRGKDEKEFRRRRQRGEVKPDEQSPQEQYRSREAQTRYAAEAAKQAQKAREETRRGAEGSARSLARARSESAAAEKRTRLLEVELHGQALGSLSAVKKDPTTGQVSSRRILGPQYKLEEGETLEEGPPMRRVFGKYGQDRGVEPVPLAEREIGAQRGLALRQYSGKVLEVQGAEIDERLERIKGAKVRRRRQKVLGPATAIARGISSTVAGVGKSVSGFGQGVSFEPYQTTSRPSLFPGTRPPSPQESEDKARLRNLTRPSGPVGIPFPGGSPPRSPGTQSFSPEETASRSRLRGLNRPVKIGGSSGPGGPKLDLPRRKPPGDRTRRQGRNTYEDHMRKIRRLMF